MSEQLIKYVKPAAASDELFDDGSVKHPIDPPPPPPIKDDGDDDATGDESPKDVKSMAYYVNGYVVDAKTGAALQGKTEFYFSDDPSRTVSSSPFGAGGHYDAWTDSPQVAHLRFIVPGYKTLDVVFYDLMQDSTVHMTKAFPWWALALVAAAAATVMNKKGVGAIEKKDVTIIYMIVGGVVGFSIIKSILEYLGLWKDKDTGDLDNASTNPNSFWNPNYWQTIKPANASYTYAFTESQAYAMCQVIVNAFGIFNDDEEAVIGVFKQCRTQANASFICWVFNKYWHDDMLTYLRGNWWPQDRLSDAELNIINQYVSRLPKY